jgi:hypothetical protein
MLVVFKVAEDVWLHQIEVKFVVESVCDHVVSHTTRSEIVTVGIHGATFALTCGIGFESAERALHASRGVITRVHAWLTL